MLKIRRKWPKKSPQKSPRGLKRGKKNELKGPKVVKNGIKCTKIHRVVTK